VAGFVSMSISQHPYLNSGIRMAKKGHSGRWMTGAHRTRRAHGNTPQYQKQRRDLTESVNLFGRRPRISRPLRDILREYETSPRLEPEVKPVGGQFREVPGQSPSTWLPGCVGAPHSAGPSP
jgi:hypothetical protein